MRNLKNFIKLKKLIDFARLYFFNRDRLQQCFKCFTSIFISRFFDVNNLSYFRIELCSL
jgi:hypothetical protein